MQVTYLFTEIKYKITVSYLHDQLFPKKQSIANIWQQWQS